MASLGILIITYNRPDDTLDLLRNLREQHNIELVQEILILNNASTVSYEAVQHFIDENPALAIRYIAHQENLGVARGRNYLIQQATADYLMFLDDDVLFADTKAVSHARTLLEEERYRNNHTAVVTFDIFYHASGARQVSAFPHKDLEGRQHMSWFLTYYFTGAAHIMKRDFFEQTGLYPPDFFYGMEEYDLSYRIIEAGYTLAYDNRIRVLHKESPLGRVTNRQKIRMMWLNKSKVAWRYLPKRYFYSTAFMWGLFYLKKSRLDIAGYIRFYAKILAVPKTEKRSPISERSLHYLKSVAARLWY